MSFEVWKPLNDRYAVSSLGRVKGIYNNRETILKSSTTCHGYPMVTMSIGQKRKSSTIHRLVATAFLGLTDESLVVNHIDGDKTNNTPSNLEVCTQQHNRKHAFFGKKRFVDFNRKLGKFRVMIRNKTGVQEYFGGYDNKEEAYSVAREQYYKIYNTYPWSSI